MNNWSEDYGNLGKSEESENSKEQCVLEKNSDKKDRIYFLKNAEKFKKFGLDWLALQWGRTISKSGKDANQFLTDLFDVVESYHNSPETNEENFNMIANFIGVTVKYCSKVQTDTDAANYTYNFLKIALTYEKLGLYDFAFDLGEITLKSGKDANQFLTDLFDVVEKYDNDPEIDKEDFQNIIEHIPIFFAYCLMGEEDCNAIEYVDNLLKAAYKYKEIDMFGTAMDAAGFFQEQIGWLEHDKNAVEFLERILEVTKKYVENEVLWENTMFAGAEVYSKMSTYCDITTSLLHGAPPDKFLESIFGTMKEFKELGFEAEAMDAAVAYVSFCGIKNPDNKLGFKDANVLLNKVLEFKNIDLDRVLCDCEESDEEMYGEFYDYWADKDDEDDEDNNEIVYFALLASKAISQHKEDPVPVLESLLNTFEKMPAAATRFLYTLSRMDN